MRKAANWVLGWVELEVTGGAGEEFFNLCARQGLGFWDMRKPGPDRWRCRVAVWDWKRAPRLARKVDCQAVMVRRGGLPGLFWQLRYRWALLAGLVLCLAAVGILSRMVLTVRVSGNKGVSTGAILSQLRAQGVRPGVFGPTIDTRQVCHSVMLELPELSWMTINLHGTVCDVLVREGVPRPELMEEDEYAHIVAKYPGIITHVDATRGQQLVEEGQTVAAGDTLIGSWVDFVEPEYYQGDMGGMSVRATGRVLARTWHTLRSAAPLLQQAKVFTGRETNRWSLEIFGHSVKFYVKGGISYDKYDKIVSHHTLTLPGGRTLPVSLRRELFREYQTEERETDCQAMETVLRAQLEDRLAQMVDGQEVLRRDWAVETASDRLWVTLLAECEQEIGLTVEDP